MTTFKNIKDIKNLRGKNNINKLVEQKRQSDVLGKASYEDDRFWKIKVDDSGEGGAIIRFLPSLDEEHAPWVKYFSFHFYNPTNGLYYIERSRRSLPDEVGNQDPCQEYNNYLYSTGKEEDKNQAKRQNRNINYVSNILVIEDEKNPENEGKVFMFRYGPKIFDKLHEQWKPTIKQLKPVDIFDYFEGANFFLIAKNVSNQRNYDNSRFDAPSRIGTDEEILAIANQQYDLQDYVSPDKFKSYEELQERLQLVLTTKPTKTANEANISGKKDTSKYTKSNNTAAPASNSLPDDDEETVTVDDDEDCPFAVAKRYTENNSEED